MNKNPFLDRDTDTGVHGRRAEKKTMRRLGARSTVGSGNLDSDKGDGELTELLLENKSTRKLVLELDLIWLESISEYAMAKGKDPALSFQFVDISGTPKPHGAWVAVPEHVFSRMLTLLGEKCPS